MKADLLQNLSDAITEQRACAVVTQLETGEQCFVSKGQVLGDLFLSDEQTQTVNEMIAGDICGQIDETTLFVRVYGPAFRLLIVGAVHIAQALAPMAQLAGFDVTVIDPRDAFLQAGRLSEIASVSDWPDDAMEKLKPDARTAVVTLTHDSKLDDPALFKALKSDAFYIGSLGSKRTHAKRLERLSSEGLAAQELDRIHAPVGLDINAKTPSEIAVSILAEIVATRRRAVE